MLFSMLELLRDQPAILVLFTFGLAGIFGGIPPMLERARRRKIENDLPSMLEALADSMGAGLGLQQAMQAEADRNTGVLGELLRQTLVESKTSSFDAALANFAAKTRSSQVQRVMNLMSTAIEQDAPLQQVLNNLAMDYERLNDLMNQREADLGGSAIMIIMFICCGLPLLIAFIVGQFAAAKQGFQLASFHQTFSLFFGASAMVAVGVSGRMLGRFKDMLWWLPLWSAVAMFLYIAGYEAIGG
ncbi:MAG TPA: hypothetical protein D7H86_02475 [Candidatus Poseidoniales archaeon]|nr:hypothetical protein [Euryarchaeota archaeon]DAC14701.1 MAG TPA: hypothetical protein D7H86_02475 [Candidatus Poseidoniales archaeon]|tara:strand:- start:671 stop:1402 length:732 start_codon:yes stop_codon:yes gene_type:complete